MVVVGKTRPLPGHCKLGSISVIQTSFLRASTHHGVQQGRQWAGHLATNKARRLPGVHPEYNATVSGRGSIWVNPPPLICSTNPIAVSLRGHRREIPPAD
ncbi:hypothetical protein TNCV_4761731 [Trichonephila clavipes]|nr:hypothetical protein TNCV_4761731 [Trichonephila clavipes]